MSSLIGWFTSKSDYPDPENIDVIEKIELICERIRSCSLLDDKRRSLTELKEYSTTHKLEVGTRSLDIIIDIIGKYQHDKEIIMLAFETLTNIIKVNKSISEHDIEKNVELDISLSERFCEILLKTPSSVQTLLGLSDNIDFQIRWHVLKILKILARSQLSRLQAVLAEIRFGYMKILDYLSDSREVIRNDCVILLLSLSQEDDHTQKILVFENMFNKLFDIILDDTTDGIVINDCIIIMTNILCQNKSTQKTFREFGLFSRVKAFFQQRFTDITDLRVTAVVLYLCKMIELCRIFLDSSQPPATLIDNQNVIARTSLFETFFSILSKAEMNDTLFVPTALVISEIIYSNNKNQSLLFHYYEENYECGVVDRVLSIAHDHSKHLSVRKSMIYLFGCYIRDHMTGLRQIVSAILNQESSDVSRYVCAGLFDHDYMSTLITSFCFIHLLINNPLYKSEFIRMSFVIDKSDNHATFTLLSRCVNIIESKNNPPASIINVLCLLVYLVYENDEAISLFLEISEISSFMVTGIRGLTNSELDVVIRGLFSVLIGIVLKFLQEKSDDVVYKNIFAHMSLLDLKNYISRFTETSQFITSSKTRILDLSLNIYIDYEVTVIVKKIEIYILDSMNKRHPDREKLVSMQDEMAAQTARIERLVTDCVTFKAQLDTSAQYIKELESRNEQLNQANQNLYRDFNILFKDHQALMEQYTYMEQENQKLYHELHAAQNVYYPSIFESYVESHHPQIFENKSDASDGTEYNKK